MVSPRSAFLLFAISLAVSSSGVFAENEPGVIVSKPATPPLPEISPLPELPTTTLSPLSGSTGSPSAPALPQAIDPAGQRGEIVEDSPPRQSAPEIDLESLDNVVVKGKEIIGPAAQERVFLRVPRRPTAYHVATWKEVDAKRIRIGNEVFVLPVWKVVWKHPAELAEQRARIARRDAEQREKAARLEDEAQHFDRHLPAQIYRVGDAEVTVFGLPQVLVAPPLIPLPELVPGFTTNVRVVVPAPQFPFGRMRSRTVIRGNFNY